MSRSDMTAEEKQTLKRMRERAFTLVDKLQQLVPVVTRRGASVGGAAGARNRADHPAIPGTQPDDMAAARPVQLHADLAARKTTGKLLLKPYVRLRLATHEAHELPASFSPL